MYSYLKQEHGIEGGWIHLIHYWLDRMTRGNGIPWQEVVTQWKDQRKNFIKHCVNEFITDVNKHNNNNHATLKTNYDTRKNMFPNGINEREYQQLSSIPTTSNNCYRISANDPDKSANEREIVRDEYVPIAPNQNDELTVDEYNNTSNSEISAAENVRRREENLFSGDGGAGGGGGGGAGGEDDGGAGVQFTMTVYTKNRRPIPARTVIYERPLFYSNGTEVPLGKLNGPRTIGGYHMRQTRRRKNRKRQTRKR